MILVLCILAFAVNFVMLVVNLMDRDIFWSIVALTGVLLAGFAISSEVTK